MAAIGYLESLLNRLPVSVKAPLVQFAQEAFRNVRFGAPDASAVACENMGGHLVPFTTSSTIDLEVAIAHQLGRDRTPRLAIPVLALDTVNSMIPALTVTRAADTTYLYLSSPNTGETVWLYVE